MGWTVVMDRTIVRQRTVNPTPHTLPKSWYDSNMQMSLSGDTVSNEALWTSIPPAAGVSSHNFDCAFTIAFFPLSLSLFFCPIVSFQDLKNPT